MQRATTRSQFTPLVSEGAGSNGIVLKDFYRVVMYGAARLSLLKRLGRGSSRSVLASLSSAALTINKMKTKQIDEAIAVNFML